MKDKENLFRFLLLTYFAIFHPNFALACANEAQVISFTSETYQIVNHQQQHRLFIFRLSYLFYL